MRDIRYQGEGETETGRVEAFKEGQLRQRGIT